MDLPLISCFGASNELPQGEELFALFDRFVMRFWITEIQDDQNFIDVISGVVGNSDAKTKLTLEELDELYEESTKVKVSNDMLIDIRKLHGDLKKKGITASDRRWKNALRVMRAVALLRGKDEVGADEMDMFADMLWDRPEDRRVILSAVSVYGNPLNAKALEWLDAAKDLLDKAEADTDKGATPTRIQANSGMMDILGKIKETLQTADPKFTARLRDTEGEIISYQKKIVAAFTQV